MNRVIAVIPTYNRQEKLVACIGSLLSQTYKLQRIIIVDNASTDNTRRHLESAGYLQNEHILYARLDENTGGAGGYYTGMKMALDGDCDWLWLMDDDAIPEHSALEQLLKQAVDINDIYCSIAIAEDNHDGILCWPTMDNTGKTIEHPGDLETVHNVRSIPFLGFFIHRKLIEKIGLPDKDYFILGDDMEYAVRAINNGARLWLVRDSIVRHPLPARHVFSFMGMRFYNLVLPPWKKYYDVRNRVLIGRKYYGYRCWTQTIPGLVVRMADSLMLGDQRLRILHAYVMGILDGLLNRKGKRFCPDRGKG